MVIVMYKVFSWREAVQNSKLQPTTKLVLFNLSFYMDSKGAGCYPTIETQANDTGLSIRAISKHLKLAREAGFIGVRKHGFSGKKWANNDYFSTFPAGFTLEQSSAPGSIPYEKGMEPGAGKVVHQVPTNSPINSPYKKNNIKKDFYPQGENPDSGGALFDSESLPKAPKPKNKKTADKINLDEWEIIHGELSIKHLAGWVKKHDLDSKKVSDAIEKYKDRALSGGRLCNNFAADFRVFVVNGWLNVTINDLKKDKENSGFRYVHGNSI